ncbi:MAG: DegT/DnrJ/EryC1/StrS family aminotransferase, partial [Syntrophaceae bacterium]
PRALEGRFILGVNYRMNELQGALGLAQLRKLDTIVAEQLKNKAAVRKALSVVPGIGFRNIPDPQGDTGTFIGFNLPSAAATKAFQKAMSAQGVDFIYFYENFWHYLPNWEHFLAKSTVNSKKYPFMDPSYKGKAEYGRELYPKAEDIMSRTLFMIIPIRMPAGRVEQIAEAAQKAAKQI